MGESHRAQLHYYYLGPKSNEFSLKGISLYLARTTLIKVGAAIEKEVQHDLTKSIINADTQVIENKHSGKFIGHLLFDAQEVLIGLAGAAVGGGLIGKLIYNLKKDSEFRKQQSIIGGLTASLMVGYISYYISKKLKQLMEEQR